ncbi:hypothetical protein AGMMS49965_17730 [Bacteroidia bacterium]|nr:hypothetical protein AGMMS49965_17730 [Bacteroidia bacterium]
METKTVKRLPYGNSNFESIMTENYAYVDKTRFVEQLENEANKYQFFIRPRKFGKSLFFSLLEHYYDVNKAKNFEKLFGELYIGKHPTPKKSAYAVLKFDFSGLDTSNEDRFRTSFSGNIQDAVRRFMDVYRNLFADAADFIQRIDEEKPGILSIRKIIDKVESADVKIFVIIDEYDHFANDLIAIGSQLGKDVYHNMVHANGLVRDFYEALKTGTKTVIDRIFITGISPVMLDDLTSGFNIAANLTLEPKYNEMMGFTQQEVDALMHETGVDPNFINVDMGMYYDGYLFHEDGENRVYNPSMILYFFYQILQSQKPPKNIIDDNLKTDYNRLRRMVQNEENRNTLIEIVQNNGIMSDVISKFSIDRLEDTKYFISLLFYMGLQYLIEKIEYHGWIVHSIFSVFVEKITIIIHPHIYIDKIWVNACFVHQGIYLLLCKAHHLIILWLEREIGGNVETACEVVQHHGRYAGDENAVDDRFCARLQCLVKIADKSVCVYHVVVNIFAQLTAHRDKVVRKMVVFVDDDKNFHVSRFHLVNNFSDRQNAGFFFIYPLNKISGIGKQISVNIHKSANSILYVSGKRSPKPVFVGSVQSRKVEFQHGVSTFLRRRMLADIQFTKQFFKILCLVYIIVMLKQGKEQTFAELARADEKLILVSLIFKLFNESCLIHISIILGHNALKIGIAIRQSLDCFCFHNFYFFATTKVVKLIDLKKKFGFLKNISYLCPVNSKYYEREGSISRKIQRADG